MFPLTIEKRIATADDRDVGSLNLSSETHIPIGNHPGAFGAQRSFDIHTGVDLYCLEGAHVFAMNAGIVVDIFQFTGGRVGSPWWNDTFAIAIEDATGIWLYGEVEYPDLYIGERVKYGQPLTRVARVLRNDKGRPTSMLHVERYRRGCTAFAPTWDISSPRPAMLIDPTQLLLQYRTE
jgi:hypothetical protein